MSKKNMFILIPVIIMTLCFVLDSRAEDRWGQSVKIVLKLSKYGFGTPDQRYAVDNMSTKMDRLVKKNKAGQIQENSSIGSGQHVIYIIGPDADKIYSLIEPVLKEFSVTRGAVITKRYGDQQDAEAREEIVNF